MIFREGVEFSGRNADTDETVADAANVDAIILCLGEDSYAEAVGDIDDLNLPRGQQELARRLSATGKPVILVDASPAEVAFFRKLGGRLVSAAGSPEEAIDLIMKQVEVKQRRPRREKRDAYGDLLAEDPT